MGHRRMRVGTVAVVLAVVGALAAVAGTEDPAEPDRGDAGATNSAVSTNVWPSVSTGVGLSGTDYSTRVAELSFTDVFRPEDGIAVANLTVRPGQYVVRYAFEARLDSAWQSLDLSCGVVDGNGTTNFLFDDPRPIRPGRDWARYRVDTTFSLPDITLGLRCFPSTTGFGSASFRNVELSATKVPS